QANIIRLAYNYGGGARTTDFTLPILTPPVGVILSNPVEIENPINTEATPSNTLSFNSYNINSITSGAWTCDLSSDFPAELAAVYTSPTIYWDNGDPPGNNTVPLAGFVAGAPGSNSLPISWTALSAANVDADFSSYRIYYKESSSSVWSMIDSGTHPLLGIITTANDAIISLQSLTAYDYYLTAIDVFGNETAVGAIANNTTLPATSSVSISDSLHFYDSTIFAASLAVVTDPLDPLDFSVIDSAIKVEIFIEGASQPDTLNLILAAEAAAPDLIVGNAINGALVLNTDYYRITALKSSPNKWAAYISSEHPLMVPGQNCRFIIEAVKNGTPVYYDYIGATASNPNDQEWVFTVVDPPVFKPWPTRILNNVITKKNPAAYPAYYLTDDANVTIKVYDVKGRVVAVLLDGAFRRSGINIKENGWKGTNKAGKKLGVGLYYIHINAKRKSDGKVILNKFEKVVISE
ncbi:MAG: hypothetical protein JW982_08995, partial [Spirochaetes bacterium]|nr:hypothetical protein [Spirochaetota bacterium]